MFFFSPLFGYYKAINPTAWPMNLFLRHDTTRSFILSWRHYVITANTIKKKKNAYLFIRFERVCTCLRVFTNFEREKNNRPEETNERYDWKRIRRMWYFFFFIYIYNQRRKLKRCLFLSSLLPSFHPPRKERSCIRYESLRFSPLFGPPYKSAHSTAINNQLFTRFSPQTFFNVSYSTPGGLRDPAG